MMKDILKRIEETAQKIKEKKGLTETKKCSTCIKVKPLAFFSKNISHIDGRQNECKECRSAYKKLVTKEKVKEQNKNRSILFEEFKKKFKCTDCGSQDFRVLQFHHLDKSLKEGTIPTLFKRNSPKFQEELDKCIPLCANCHTIRHYNERLLT